MGFRAILQKGSLTNTGKWVRVAFWWIKDIDIDEYRILKKNIDIDEEIKISCLREIKIMKIKTYIDSFRISLDILMLSPDNREVVVHIAGYNEMKIVKKKT